MSGRAQHVWCWKELFALGTAEVEPASRPVEGERRLERCGRGEDEKPRRLISILQTTCDIGPIRNSNVRADTILPRNDQRIRRIVMLTETAFLS